MSWKSVRLVAFLCLLGCLNFAMAEEKLFQVEQALPFTSVTWSNGGQNHGPGTANRLVTNPLKVGEQSLELTYDFLGVAGQFNNCDYSAALPLPVTADVVRIWLYGDGSGHNFILRLGDDFGQIFQYRSVPITWNGWKLLEFKLKDPSALSTHWGGANDGVMNGKISIKSLLVEPRTGTTVAKGKVYVGGVSVVALLTEAESVTLEAGSPKLGNIFTDKDEIQFSLRFTNYSDQRRQLNVRYWVEANDRSFPRNTMGVALDAGESATRQIALDDFRLNGCFNLVLQISSSDQKIMLKKQIPFSRCLSPSEKPRTGIVGAQTHFQHGLAKNPLAENLELLRLSGATWYRDEMCWGNAEKTKGKIEILPEWDERIDTSLQKGLTPLLELNFGNRFYDQGGFPYTDEAIAAFVKYCTTMVEHFKGRINHFEIWNEPNIKGFNPTNRPPEDYAKLIKAVYQAIKAVNPDATVIGCSTAGVDLGWIERAFKAGALDYMDGVSVHPYCYPRSPEDGGYLKNLQLLKELMERYGELKPIWITEVGWPTHSTTSGVSELKSGAYAVRMNVLSLASAVPVAMLNWYNLQNKGIRPEDNEDNFGLVKASSGVEVPFAAKQNFIAFNTMNRMLDGAKFLEKLEASPAISAYKFALPEQKQLLVLWALNSQETIGIKTASSKVEVVDLFGNRFSLYPTDGVLTVTASDQPLYLLGDFNAVCKPLFSLTNHSLSSVAGEAVTIQLYGAEAAANVEQLAVDLPNGWTMKEQKDFSADSLQAQLVIKLPAGAAKKDYLLPIYLLGGKRVLAKLQATVSVKESLALELSPALRDSADWKSWDVAVTVINRTNTRSTSGFVNVAAPVEFANPPSPLTFTLAPNERRTFMLPLKTVPQTPIRVEAEVSSIHGDELLLEKDMSFLAAVRRKTPLAVDGELSEAEWGKAMPFRVNQASQIKEIKDWGGPLDLSGVGYLQWDDEYLYLAVAATDDVFNQNGLGSDIWSGDSVQFGIDPARKWKIGADGNHELGFALGQTGAITWRWAAAYGRNVGPLPETVKVAVTRKGNITSYEAAIPWSELVMLKPAAGTLLGFSLLINDNDGSGRGWIEYMSGIGSAKDVTLFGDLLLIE